MWRWIGYGVVGVVAVVAAGAGAVFAVDAWRAAGQVPPDCEWTFYEPRGDLLDDGGVRSRAWAALTDPDARNVDADLSGSRPELNRSCVLFAGNTTAGTTVVFADRTIGGYQSFIRLAEVRMPPDQDTVLAAVATHSVTLGTEFRSGTLLPLSGFYLPGDSGDRVTVLSAADGYAQARPAPAVGDHLFDLGVAPDQTRDSSERVDVDALLLVEDDQGAESPMAVALPTNVPEPIAPTARPSYQLVAPPEVGQIDVATLRAVGPALSAMRADPRYPLVRDHALRPGRLVVAVGPDGLTIVL